MVFFYSIYIANFDVFLYVIVFAVKAFWLILDVLTLAKFVKFLKRSTVMGGNYFLIFQPKYILSLCLNLNESQSTYAYKCYSYKKRMYLHSLQTPTILVVNSISLLYRYWKYKPFCS